MKVFGIGLNKTGTTSLGRALDTLGFKEHIGCTRSLTKDWSEGNISSILMRAEKYNNFEDWPWPLVYQDLYKNFNDAKFILTKRTTAEEWFDSLCKHSLKTGPTEYRKLIYGHYMPHDFKKEHIDFYNNHNRSVIEFFEHHDPSKLLVISFSEGDNWVKMCEFLNKKIPNSDFPILNRSKEKKMGEEIYVENRYLIRLIILRRLIKKMVSKFFK